MTNFWGGPSLSSVNTWTADQTFDDNVKLLLGTGKDASLLYDGIDLIIDPKEVGSGRVLIGINVAGPALLSEAATSNNPTLIPNRADLDTGIGCPTADQLSLIAGGVECVRISETLGAVAVVVGGGIVDTRFPLDVAFPARIATANQDYSHARVTAAGAVTIPIGTAPNVSALRIVEPNIIATGTVTRASTLLVEGIPTEGTTNAGLIINGDIVDQAHLVLANDDVVTGLSTLPAGAAVATDWFFQISNASGVAGGAFLQGFGETGQASSLFFEGWAGAPATTDTSASLGAINFFAGQHNGANAALNMGVNSNLLAVGETDSTSTRRTRLLLKADDGELHLGNSTLVALDFLDDRQIVRALQRESAVSGIIQSSWDNPFYSYSKLEEIGLVGEKDDEGFFLFPLQTRLHAHEGAIWQNYMELREYESHFATLEEHLSEHDEEILVLKQTNQMLIKENIQLKELVGSGNE